MGDPQRRWSPIIGRNPQVRARLLPFMLIAAVAACLWALPAGADETSPERATAKDDQASAQPERSPLETKGQELVDLRTATSRTFDGPGDTRIVEISPGPIHYRSAGDWRPIDNRWRATSDGSFANAAHRYRATLPAGFGDGVRVELDGVWAELTLTGADATAAATTSGKTATYGEALPEADVTYTATGDALKEDLVLRSPKAASNFEFDLRLAPGLTARSAADGGIDVVS